MCLEGFRPRALLVIQRVPVDPHDLVGETLNPKSQTLNPKP